MRLYIAIVLIVICGNGLLAQGNLVQNGGFESISKRIKDGGSIESAYPWMSGTENPVDLFCADAKAEDYQTPINKYGDGDPLEGGCYAGLVIYSYKDEDPRTYLQTKLSSTLEEGKVYCVKMSVMLSMLSKYASNNIGMYISDKSLDEEALAANAITPQVIHSQNRMFSEMFGWEDICQSYIAKGGERYLIIGNFASSDETEAEKTRKPKGITGVQARSAYYYVDEVSVMNMAGLETCDCEVDQSGSSLNVVYTVEQSTEMEIDVTEDIEMSRIYFKEMSSELTPDAVNTITKVAKLLESHPKYKVEVVGHTDPVEEIKVTGDVSLMRANAVKNKLIELGAYEKKLMVMGVQDFNPATKDASIAGQAQNRRVVFKVVSKE